MLLSQSHVLVQIRYISVLTQFIQLRHDALQRFLHILHLQQTVEVF